MRKFVTWLFLLALSTWLALSVTVALSDAVGEASISTPPLVDRPFVPDGIPDGADAWSAGKLHLQPAHPPAG